MSNEITVTLTDIANGGQAIGRAEDKTLFVPFAIPGEEVVVRITDDKGRFAFAEGVRVLDPSADRVAPRCPHFGPHRCGKCHWQHIDYPAQIALKTDIVADQLARIGKFDEADVLMTLPAPAEWTYQTAARLHPTPDGKLGFLSNDIPYQIDECHVVTPAIWNLIEQLEFDSLESVSYVEVRENGAGDLMVIISTSDDTPPALELDFKASINFLLSDGEPANLIGHTHLMHTILGQPTRITAGVTLRPNPAQVDLLLEVLNDWLLLDGTEGILDLYCGAGLYAAQLAPIANFITCVDSYPPALTDAEANLEAFDNINIIDGAVEDVLPDLPEAYDIAIVDPPPEGMSKDALDALGAAAPPRIIYIADDPAILARDCRRLQDRYGYNLGVVQPIDFQPQTYRVVTVANLRKD